MANEQSSNDKRYGNLRKELLTATTAFSTQEVGPQGYITQGEAISTVEAADAARKLGFWENVQLHNLNTPLLEAGMAFPFLPEDVRRADPAECDVLISVQEVIHPEGSSHAMALIDSTRGINAEGKLLTGKFDSIFMPQKEYEKSGGKLVVVTDGDVRLSGGEVQGKIAIEKGVLDEINGKLGEINRRGLDEELTRIKSDEKVVGFDIVPSKDDKSNSFFFNRGHVGLILTTDQGRSILLTKNARNERGEEGSVNMVRLTDGRYGIVNTVRMLVGAGANYRPEMGRGYADVGVAKVEKALKEKYGEDWKADQVGMELGLVVEKALKIESSELRQDIAYEDVTPKLQIMEFDKNVVMKTAPDYVQHMMEEFEGLTPKKANPEEILQSIESGRMVCGFSIGLFGSEFLSEGIVKINPNYLGNDIILERRSITQEGGRERLVVPQCKAFEKGARNAGQVHPNTGNARFWYQARVSQGNLDLLPDQGKFENLPVEEVVEMMKKRDFTTVDNSVLFKSLFYQRVLIPNL